MESMNPSGPVVSPMPNDAQNVQNLVSSGVSDNTPLTPQMASIGFMDDARELHGLGSPDAGVMMHVLADVETTNVPQTSIAAISFGISLFIVFVSLFRSWGFSSCFQSKIAEIAVLPTRWKRPCALHGLSDAVGSSKTSFWTFRRGRKAQEIFLDVPTR